MESFSSQTSSVNDSQPSVAFELFKNQLEKVQLLIDKLSDKIIDKTLCIEDLNVMKKEMEIMINLEYESKPSQLLSTFVAFKVRSLKTVQESYRICNWLMEKECYEMDNIFDINTYIDKIIDACEDKEDPLNNMNTLFKDCFMNTDHFYLSFYGNITLETSVNSLLSTQTKKECRRSQKRPLEEQVVPVEVDNDASNNELQVTLMRVNHCLKRAIRKNNGNPVSFFKFAIDPFSFTHTVENLFHLASLVKDRIVQINKNSDNDFELATITFEKKKIDKNIQNKKDDFISSLLTINHDLWQFYKRKFDIHEQMIDQK